jgi:phage protein D
VRLKAHQIGDASFNTNTLINSLASIYPFAVYTDVEQEAKLLRKEFSKPDLEHKTVVNNIPAATSRSPRLAGGTAAAPFLLRRHRRVSQDGFSATAAEAVAEHRGSTRQRGRAHAAGGDDAKPSPRAALYLAG